MTSAPPPVCKGRLGRLREVVIAIAMACLTGCASLSGGHTHTFYCPYDTVWEETLHALHPATVTKADKGAGAIETDWEQGMSEAKSGVFGRSNLVQERSSIVVKLEKEETLTTIRVNHVRQQHHLEGTRSLRWLHAPAVPEVESAILARIHNRVKKQGCHAV